jgi:hypothetical protein
LSFFYFCSDVFGEFDNFSEAGDFCFDDVVVTQDCKKRRRRPIVPRIMKRDIRLVYSTMFTNMFNIMDYNLCSGFFREFCAPDLNWSYTMCPKLSEKIVKLRPHAPKLVNVISASQAAQFIYASSHMMPDLSLQTSVARIIGHAGREESEIVFNFVIEGTQIHDTDLCANVMYEEDFGQLADAVAQNNALNMELEDTRSENSNDTDTTDTDSSITTSCIERDKLFQQNINKHSYLIDCTSHTGRKGYVRGYTAEDYRSLLNSAPLLACPIQARVEGCVTMFLDAHKRITKFVMNSVDIKLPPGPKK